MPQKVLCWDLPVRICHWAFAGSLASCFLFALAFDEHDALFRYHMLFGLLAGFVLLLRLMIGLVGARAARFTSFPVAPRLVFAYFRDVLLNRKDASPYEGNNPGSALAALAMFALVPFILLTGLSQTEALSEDFHAVLAYVLGAVIAAHLLGIVIHTLRTRENIGMAMITGRKDAPLSTPPGKAYTAWGLVILAVILSWAVGLYRGYLPAQGAVRLPLLGLTVQLSEQDENQGGRESRHSHEKHGDGDSD